MTQVLTNIYVHGSQKWPDFLIFKNNDGTPPWQCTFSFQQRELYVLGDGKIQMKICGNCKAINCNFKDPNCPLNKSTRNAEVAAYLKLGDEKKRKRGGAVDTAKKNMALLKSKNKGRFK
jgi:hypothetical protein